MKNNYPKVLKVHSGIQITDGFTRSTIADLQRKEFDIIPSSLSAFLNKFNGLPIEYIYSSLPGQESIIDSYIDFLLERDYIILGDVPEGVFDIVSDPYPEFAHINNAIIDADNFTSSQINMISKQLLEVGCQTVCLRYYQSKSLAQIEEIISTYNGSRFRCIDISIKYFEEVENIIKDFLYKYQRIRFCTIHSSPYSKLLSLETNGIRGILMCEDVINDHYHCGFVGPEYFQVDQRLFFESIRQNTCLARKVGIDFNGEIKNCPAGEISYGNISSKLIKDVVYTADFMKIWDIHKDQIEVCKDCEFRHLCTDCRMIIESSNNIYSKPLRCNYDPYEGVWKNETNSAL